MKRKKLQKKLRLNKATVADLNKHAMVQVKGGLLTIRITCVPQCDTDLTCEDLTVCGPVCWTQKPTICGPGTECDCTIIDC